MKLVALASELTRFQGWGFAWPSGAVRDGIVAPAPRYAWISGAGGRQRAWRARFGPPDRSGDLRYGGIPLAALAVRQRITCEMDVGRAFSPFELLGQVSRAAGPGWYEIAPLAVGNWGGSDPRRIDEASPYRCCFSAMGYV